MADIVSLNRYKTALGKPLTVAPTDARDTAALTVASEMIRNYTGLKFELGVNPPTTRDFWYDHSGYLDIDECHTITDVTTRSGYTLIGDIPRTLTVDEWLAFPLNSPVKFWITLPGVFGYGGGSPEMGFTRNLDTMPWRAYSRPDILTITATWGWTAIPADVEQAVIWTAAGLAEVANTSGHQSESIENYSWTKAPGSTDDALPLKVQAILQPYIIPRV